MSQGELLQNIENPCAYLHHSSVNSRKETIYDGIVGVP